MITIGNKLKQLRHQKGMTQQQLATQLCVSRQTISSWETDRNIPDIETLTRIAAYFNIQVGTIISSQNADSVYLHKYQQCMMDIILAILLVERVTQLSTTFGLHWMNFIVIFYLIIFFLALKQANYFLNAGLIIFGMTSILSGFANLFWMGFGFRFTCFICGVLSLIVFAINVHQALFRKQCQLRKVNRA